LRAGRLDESSRPREVHARLQPLMAHSGEA
jgi:hypothetical protein